MESGAAAEAEIERAREKGERHKRNAAMPTDGGKRTSTLHFNLVNLEIIKGYIVK